MPKNANAKPCQNCDHNDLHGDVSGCIAVTSPQGAAQTTWCDCEGYVEPPSTKAARVIPSRNTDPATSHAAAAGVRVTAKNQRGLLLAAWAKVVDATDEEAMEKAVGVSALSEYAKRSSELRDAGLIALVTNDDGAVVTRKGASGAARIVSRITDAGTAALKSL